MNYDRSRESVVAMSKINENIAQTVSKKNKADTEEPKQGNKPVGQPLELKQQLGEKEEQLEQKQQQFASSRVPD